MSKNLTFVNDPWIYDATELGIYRDEDNVGILKQHKVLKRWQLLPEEVTFTAEDLLEIVAKLNELNSK